MPSFRFDPRGLFPDRTQATILDVLRARGVPSEQEIGVLSRQPSILEALARPTIPQTLPGGFGVNPPVSPFIGNTPQGILASLLEAARTVPQTFQGFSPEALRRTVPATNLLPQVPAALPGVGTEAELVAQARFGLPFAKLPTAQRASVLKETQIPKVGTDVESVALEIYDAPFSGLNKPERANVQQELQKRRIELAQAQAGVRTAAESKKRFTPALATLEELERQAGTVFSATGPLSRILRAPQAQIGVLLQADPAMVQFEALKGGTLATFVRIFGDVGALSEGDIDRAKNLMPKLLPIPDTREVALGKLKQLRKLIQEISQRGALPQGQAVTPLGTTEDGKPVILLPDGRQMVID